jgi:hypothetical protein
MNGSEIGPPVTAEQERAALKSLAAEDGDERYRAALALGLGGKLPAFRQMMATRADQSLRTFASHYVNEDGNSCVAPEIEDTLLAHFDDPVMRPALLTFFAKNLYTRSELFERLIRVELADGKPQDFFPVVRALTATRLEDVEGRVLAQAESYLGHDTPVLKRVLPAVHRSYVKYFAERAYAPSIDYMERLLQVEGYGETLDSFIAEFSVTRSTVYRALDSFPSAKVGGVFTRQLNRVARECSALLINYELSAFGTSAVRHATTDEQRRLVAGSLAALLGHGLDRAGNETPPVPEVDYRVYKKIVELLAELGTPEAGQVLVNELYKLTELDDRSLSAMTTQLLHALARLPASAEPDVPAILEAATGLPGIHRLLHVPLVLEAHPDPAAQAFYLGQISWILDNWDDLKSGRVIDPERSFWRTIDRLEAFDEDDQLAHTRDELDRLFLAGVLSEDLFEAASASINELGGAASPVYEELMRERRLAIKAEKEEKRVTEQAQWLKITDDNTSPDGIRKNLERLGEPGSGSRDAAAWLVIAGPDILPAAHERLADPSASAELRFRLMQVLGEVGDPRSVEVLIEATRREKDNRAILRAGLRALGLMPSSQLSFDFAKELMADGEQTHVRQGAIIYLASVTDERATELARKYSAAEVEPEIRVAALLLAARLGQSQAKSAIIELLETTTDRSHGEVLVRALGELSTLEELSVLAERFPAHRSSFNPVSALVAFRGAEGDRRVELARRLIESGHPWDRREVVRSLVEDGPHELLFRYLLLSPAMGLPLEQSVLYSPNGVAIVAQIRRMGYRIEETPVGFELVRND